MLFARKTRGNEPLMDYSQFHVVAFGEYLCQKRNRKGNNNKNWLKNMKVTKV
jgi:hypothetical protein